MDEVVPPRDADVPGRPAQARLWNWDALRWVATIDIVALHTTGAHGVFGWGLPLYLVMTCALAARSGRRGDLELHRRVRRLLAPWLWGCALYGGTRVVDAAVAEQPLLGWFTPAQLLYGPRVHLWFLPYACMAGVAVAALAVALRRLSSSSASVVLALGTVAAGWLAARAPTPWPYSQWVFSLPALGLGLALGLRVGRGVRAPLVGCIAALLALAWVDPASPPLVSRFVGAALLLGIAVELPQVRTRFIVRYTPALLAVYVLHPWVFAELVHDSLWRVGLGAQAWARTGVTLVVAFGLSLALSQVAGWIGLRSRASVAEPVRPTAVST